MILSILKKSSAPNIQYLVRLFLSGIETLALRHMLTSTGILTRKNSVQKDIEVQKKAKEKRKQYKSISSYNKNPPHTCSIQHNATYLTANGYDTNFFRVWIDEILTFLFGRVVGEGALAHLPPYSATMRAYKP